jgi:GntR family transcriptional regulator of arabinose operon
MESQKKYLQIYEAILGRIERGDYSAGDKLPTEQEFIKEYGFSRQTVRQALFKLESDKVINRVQGSGSFVASVAVGRKKTMRIAVITTYISTYIFPAILRGIETTATAAGYSILLKATNNSVAQEHDVLENILPHDVDGVIVEGTKTALPNPNLAFYRALAGNHIPLVFINSYYPELDVLKQKNIRYVITDDYQGSYGLTAGLIQKGHTAIGGIFKSDDMQSMRRYAGYMDALLDSHQPVKDEQVLWFNTETKFGIAQQLAQTGLPQGCTAIVCYNDEVSQQVMQWLQTQSKSAITAMRSFDNTLCAQACGLDFFSLQHPKEAVGIQAAQKLIALMNGDMANSTILSWG